MALPVGIYTFRNVAYPNKMLNLYYNGSLTNGQNVILWNSDGSLEQQWKYDDGRLLTMRNESYALDRYMGSGQNLYNADVWAVNDSAQEDQLVQTLTQNDSVPSDIDADGVVVLRLLDGRMNLTAVSNQNGSSSGKTSTSEGNVYWAEQSNTISNAQKWYYKRIDETGGNVPDGTIPVEAVIMQKYTLGLTVGQHDWLYADVEPYNATNQTLEWKSDNELIATVDDGFVTAVGAGQTQIRAEATDGSGRYGVCTVTVNEPVVEKKVTSITLSKTCISLCPNGSEILEITRILPNDATDKEVVFSSMDTSVATVNPNSGLILAQNAGCTTIVATAADGGGAKAYCDVEVSGQVYVESVNIPISKITLTKEDEYDLWATISPEYATDKRLLWYSENPNVAEVTQTGHVTTKKIAGTAKIHALAADRSIVGDVCEVVVRNVSKNPEEEEPDKNSERLVHDPIDSYSGAHVIKNTLMTLFSGQGISLTANYDSSKLMEGDLGKGWYHNFEKTLTVDGTEAKVYSSPSSYSKYTSNDCGYTFICSTPNKNGYILTVNECAEYSYILNCNYMMTEMYDEYGRLAKVIDHQGFETLISYETGRTTITDVITGKKIYLDKDSNCRVTRVYDDSNRETKLTYSNNLITGIRDVNSNQITYTYDENGQILTGTDANGICYFTNTYDEQGRVITQKDGISGSMSSTINYGEDGSNERISTNRNGHTSRRVFDENGLLTTVIDEESNAKSYSYDTRYNITKETDANGNSIVKTYNSFNKPTSITDKNGNKTLFEYDTRGNLTKITYPKISNVTSCETFTYNYRNQMLTHTDTRGTVTQYTYDTAGMPKTKKVGSRNAIQYNYQSGLLKSETDAMGNTTQYDHNAAGQVIKKIDAENNVTLYEYDLCGNLLKVTDALGKTITTTYDGNYQKTSVKDALGYETFYSYNGNMKNTLVGFPDGHTISYEFDGEDRVTKVTDQAGKVTTTQYDNCGRVVSQHFADGGVVSFEYDKVGNVIKQTNQKGAVTLKTYDNNGNVLSVTDSEGNITRYQYNALGKVVRTVNSMSGTIVSEYSPAGDLISETDALGNKKTYTYDMFGNLLTVTDAMGNITTYTYDMNGNLLTVKDALNNVTTYTYDSLNQLVNVMDARYNTVSYQYDALGRRIKTIDGYDHSFETVYDGNGNAIKTIDAKGNTVSESTYNCLNLPSSVTTAQGGTVSYTYTPLGKVATVTDSMNRTSQYSYDQRGRNTSVCDANNATSSMTYDEMGNVTRLSGPLGGSTNYTYDTMGRLISETTSSGGTVTYGYNELGLKEELTNARGEKRKFFYDAMGRVTGYVGKEDSVSYTYDKNSNVLTVTDKNGTVAREYDKLNRIVKCTDTEGKVIQYQYDAVGNLIRITYPDNTSVGYLYDSNNNLVRVCDWDNRITTYTYDENNKVIRVVKPDGSVTTNTYDSKQRLVSSVDKTSWGSVICGFEYTYDSLSKIVEEKNLANSTKVCYTYDNLNRVTNKTVKDECENVLSEETFSYDAAGNISNAQNSSFEYDTNNRLTVFNGNTVSYDYDGNMLTNGIINCEYDSANRLIKAGNHEYTYNAEDTRIKAVCDSKTTVYTYDTVAKLSRLLCKTTNGVTTKYAYGLGLIGEEVANECFKTYHFDYRGSTVAIIDECGYVTDTFKYDTYGKMISRTGTTEVIFGYNGRDGVVTETNGLIYMRARYYSPEMRRFINADIITGSISNAITLNRYAYANGNPVSNVDPFGLSVEERGNWYGAHADTKTTITTIDDDFDLTFGLNLITLYRKQTVTSSQKYGKQGDWFDAYAYTDVDITEGTATAGAGLKLLYVLGFDVNVKFLGAEATLSLNTENASVYGSIEVDLFGDTTASVGITSQLDDNTEVNDQVGISGNTWFVICTICALLTGVQMDPTVTPKPIPIPGGV